MNVYRTETGLRGQVLDVLEFLYPDCLDDRYGGYVAALDERDGHVYDARTKHLVATARAVHNFAVGALLDGPVWCRPAAERGLDFLEAAHWDAEHGGYDWLLAGRETADATRHCYGHAFVVLAGARAHQAGIAGGLDVLERAYDVLDEHFWEPDRGLCADRAAPDWSETVPYRGANANMHACEALLAAHEATGEAEYLDRAHRIADAFTREVAAQTDGLLWEHYTADWEADLEYNREEPGHRFRPWGYQPGHHAEWAKLLGVLAEHRGESWPRERARELFDAAVELGWDDEHGGLCYTVDGDGEPVDADKYGWVHAEAIGAAAVLSGSGEGEGKGAYGEWYDRLWGYAAEHFRNPRHGNWYQRLARDWTRDGPNRGTAVEPGYHPLTNAWLALRYLDLADEPRPGERPGPPG